MRAILKNTIKTLSKIIDLQFNYIKRKDLFWIFNVLDEILLKSDKIEDTFVKEFILLHCLRYGPFYEPMVTPPIKSLKYPLKHFSNQEFY